MSIYRTILFKYNKITEQTKGWVIELKKFIKEVQSEVFDNAEFRFKEPSIIPELKEGSKYRPISSFLLKDKIIASLTSKYLTKEFEKLWIISDCAYAFRDSEKNLTHHSAIEDVLEYKKRHKILYASECDIQKFFDSVKHTITKSIYEKYCNNFSSDGCHIDPIATKIFNAYLDCFSFKKTVLDKASNWFEKSNIKDTKAHFEWIEKLLEAIGETNLEEIGVPQGGALSCFISNLILHEVDTAIKCIDDEDLFYARYCDDMIIIHPSKEKCLYYLNQYISELKKLFLFHHEPEIIEKYDKNFWNSKSKFPYLWDDNKQYLNAVPWLSFVGYQIKSDSTLRVRPKSIKKEKIKQVKVIDQALKNLNIKNKLKAEKNLAIKTQQIVFRVRKKLLAMSIGAIDVQQLKGGNKFCWVEGFRLLKTGNFNQTQIKSLDRNRLKQVHRLKRHLIKLRNPTTKRTKKDIPFQKFDSPKLSYFKQFRKAYVD